MLSNLMTHIGAPVSTTTKVKVKKLLLELLALNIQSSWTCSLVRNYFKYKYMSKVNCIQCHIYVIFYLYYIFVIYVFKFKYVCHFKYSYLLFEINYITAVSK